MIFAPPHSAIHNFQKIIFQVLFKKINFQGLQKTVLEIIHVPHHTLHIKLSPGITNRIIKTRVECICNPGMASTIFP